jgi:hypothetical protein
VFLLSQLVVMGPTGWEGVDRPGGKFEVWLVAVLTQHDIMGPTGWEGVDRPGGSLEAG